MYTDLSLSAQDKRGLESLSIYMWEWRFHRVEESLAKNFLTLSGCILKAFTLIWVFISSAWNTCMLGLIFLLPRYGCMWLVGWLDEWLNKWSNYTSETRISEEIISISTDKFGWRSQPYQLLVFGNAPHQGPLMIYHSLFPAIPGQGRQWPSILHEMANTTP